MIIGLGVVALLQLFALPNASNKVEYIIAYGAVGLFEGIILVATPALVRDFTPQLGRASAMGFWTLGPVAGLLLGTEFGAHTLGVTSGDWQREFIVSGVVGIVVFFAALLFLRELSPPIPRPAHGHRTRPGAGRAEGQGTRRRVGAQESLATDGSLRHRCSRSYAIVVMLVLFYTASATFPPAFFTTVFDKATHWSSLPQANALATWMWGADCIGLVLCGILSDILRVRKPFMFVGAIGVLAFTVVLISHAGHVNSSYYTVVWICCGIFFFQAMVYGTWMASFTETAEAHNPALIATALSIWGGIARLVVAIMFIFLPFLITSAGIAGDNAYRAMTPQTVTAIRDIVAGKMPKLSDINARGPLTQIANIVPPASIISNTYPRLVAIVQAHPTDFAEEANYPGTSVVTRNPSLYGRLLEDVHGDTGTLLKMDSIAPDLQFLGKYRVELTRLKTVNGTAPREWQHWLWICFGCTAFFIPFVFVMKGRWSSRSARRDEREHEAFMEKELASIRVETTSVGAGDVPLLSPR